MDGSYPLLASAGNLPSLILCVGWRKESCRMWLDVQYFPKLVSPLTLFDRFSNPNAKIYHTIIGIASEY
jgi:hypothetical protein